MVYSSQMAVEQASKAVLLVLGVGYPRGHDVSAALRMVPGVKGVPGWFKSMVDGLAGYGMKLVWTPSTLGITPRRLTREQRGMLRRV